MSINTTKIAAIIITILLGIVVYLAVWHEIFATNNDDVKLCHKLGNGTFNYLVVDDDALEGHLGHGDFLYQGPNGNQNTKNIWCNNNIPQVTPTVTPSPSIAPTSTPEPTVTPPIEECEDECQEDPTPTPTPAPTIIEEVVVHKDNWSQAGSPLAPVCELIKHAPTIYEVGRIDADSVYIKWTPVDDFVQDYVVQYGLGPIPMWNTIVQGVRETELNMLPDWLHIWARVAGTHQGCIGNFGEWVDP